jgi:hypothetical protein
VFLEETRIKKYCSNKCSGTINGNDKVDWVTVNRKSYQDGKRVGGGKTKWYQMLTSNGKFKVQGNYEVRVCKILDRWKNDNKISNWEYTNDRIPYLDSSGQKRTYLLDFKIFNFDGSYYYIEVKGYTTDKDILKWASALALGLDLRIWFNKEITKEEMVY